MTDQGSPFRFLRTAVLAIAVLALAAGAHVLGGGQLPPAPVMAACTALTTLGVMAVTRWKMSAFSLAGILTAGQGMLHEAFSALAGPASAPSGPALHFHGVAAGGPGLIPTLPSHPQTHLEPPMMAAHILATLLTAVLLSRGEAALWALAAWLRPLTVLRAVRIPAMSRQPLPPPFPQHARRWRALGRHPLRGPPAPART